MENKKRKAKYYYRANKEKLKNRSREYYRILSEKKKKKKMLTLDIKICQMQRGKEKQSI